MRGGGGNDVFRFDNAADSNPVATDTIEDFAAGDKIDLSRIDANSSLAGDQSFNFIGNAAFGSHAGELRAENLAGTTWRIEGDTDGDGAADFELMLVADPDPITVGDFML